MTASLLAQRISRALVPFERLRRAVLRFGRPHDIHDLRVLTRRLRAALRAARLFLPRRQILEARNALRRLGRALGPVRAFDVALEDLGAHPERESIERRRRHAFSTLSRDAISPLPALRRLAAQLRRALPRRHLRRRLARWRIRVRVPATKLALHRLRIDVKKVRYLLETFQALGLCPKPPLSRLQRLQRELGRAHDFEMLRRFLKRPPDHLSRRERRHAIAGKRLAQSTARAANAALDRAALRLDE